jgi:thioredoxin reductase (NADPH)
VRERQQGGLTIPTIVFEDGSVLIEQAKRYSFELLSAQNVVKVGNDEDAHFVEAKSGNRYRSNAVLIATGSTYKRLGVPGEDYIGAGVHFCATCDGPSYNGKEVAVIGGGNSAVEGAAFLTLFCPKVTILARVFELKANKIAVVKALSSPQMEVHFNGEKNHL